MRASNIPSVVIFFLWCSLIVINAQAKEIHKNHKKVVHEIGIVPITLTSGAGTNNQTVCPTAGITSITYSIVGTISNATVTGLPLGISGALSGNIYTISGSSSKLGNYNYQLSVLLSNNNTYSASGSIGIVNSKGISAYSLTSAEGTDAQPVCKNSPITPVVYSISVNEGGNPVTGVTATGLPPGVTGQFTSGVFTISGTPTVSGTYQYSLQTTGDLCINTTVNGSITVSDPGSSSSTVTACNSYIWPVNGQVYTSTGTYTTVSGCVTKVLNLTIANVSSLLTLTSASGSNQQTICSGAAISDIKYAVPDNWIGSSVTGVYSSGLPAGLSGVLTGNTFIISGTPTVTGEYNYTVYATATSCGITQLKGSVKINASSSSSTTATACDSYTWAVNNQTYTTTGTYTSVSGCNTATLNLTINGIPILPYSVTGGGTYCTGGAGLAVGLSGSQAGVSYQLKLNGTNIGSAVAGTGAAISFGNQAAAGTYTVLATVIGTTCTGNMTGSVAIVIASNPTASIVNNTGTTILTATVLQISLTATGGTSYSWSNGSTVLASTANYIVTVPGTYTVTVTNAAGCSSTASITITSTLLNISAVVTNILCNGSKTGAINITVSGGKTPYTFSWSSGQKTEDLVGLAAGSYTVTVTDAAKTKKTATYTITQPTALVLTTTVSNLSCTGPATGSIAVTASGGTPTYSITLNTGTPLVGGEFSGLTAGTYTITLKDANNCSIVKTVTVAAFSPIAFTTAVVANSSCTPNGYITVTATTGKPPYSYSKDNGLNWQASNIFNGLSAGTYAIKVKDVNLCLSNTVNSIVTDNGSDGYEVNKTNTDNNTSAKSYPLTLESLYIARIGKTGDQDWYSYKTAATAGAGTYYLLFSQALAGQTYELYNSSSKLIAANVTGVIDAGTVYKQYNGLLANTTYYIKIAGTVSLNCYRVKLTRNLPTTGISLLPLSSFEVGNAVSAIVPDRETVFKIFPNPAKSLIVLELDNMADENGELLIRNVQGQIVLQKKFGLYKNLQRVEVKIDDLTNGFYVCQLIKSSGIQSIKFLKE